MIDPSTTLSWIASGLALLLLLLLSVAEYRRYGKGGRLYLRVLLLLLAVGGLLLAYLKPGYQARGAATTIILNTEEEALLDSLLQVYPAAEVLSLQPHNRYPRLEGLSYLSRYAPAGSAVFIVGEGVPRAELSYLKPYHIKYLPADAGGGILNIQYKRNASVSDSLALQGYWQAEKAGERLLLSLGSIALDSVLAQSAEAAHFSLAAPLHFSGRRVYRLYRLNGAGDTLETYQLPLSVEAPALPQLALLTAYPEAETKYLKEYLRQQGYKLYYLAQLAPGIEVKEGINLPQQPFQFNQKALQAWDVLMLSAGYYASLGKGVVQEVERAVYEGGRGLMLLPDAASNSLQWQGSRIGFGSEVLRDTFVLEGKGTPLEYRPILKVPEGWQPLLAGRKGVAAISRRWGLGQLVVSGVVSSYPLVLKGRESLYHQFWSLLFQQALPLQEKMEQWELPLVSAVHWPRQLALHSPDSLPELQLLGPDQQPMPLSFWASPQLLAPGWQAVFWPRQPGWHTAMAKGDTAMFWVASRESGLLKAQQQEQLLKLEAMQRGNSEGIAAYKDNPVSQWWFFALFITGMGGLWLEKKLKG